MPFHICTSGWVEYDKPQINENDSPEPEPLMPNFEHREIAPDNDPTSFNGNPFFRIPENGMQITDPVHQDPAETADVEPLFMSDYDADKMKDTNPDAQHDESVEVQPLILDSRV